MGAPVDAVRTQWVDTAKGVAIVMVVVHHVVMALHGAGLLVSPITYINYSLNSFRMPLLFLASGIFAGAAVAGTWKVVLHKRVAHYLYLYLLWMPIYLLALVLVPRPGGQGEIGWSRWLPWLVTPDNGLWFLYALAVYSVALRMSRRVPPVVQLAVSGALYLAGSTGLLDDMAVGWRSILMYSVFFVLGVHGSVRIRAAASRAGLVSTAVLAVAAAGIWAVKARFDLHGVPGVTLVESSLFVAAVISGCVVISGRRFDPGLRWLGSRTLPVYLMHVPVVMILTTPAVLEVLDLSRTASVAMVPVLAGAAISSSLVLHRVLTSTGGGWLFALPARWAWRSTSSRPPVPGLRPGAVTSAAAGAGEGRRL